MPSPSLFRNLVDITPYTESGEAGGGTVRASGTVIASVSCSMQKPSASRVIAHAKEGATCDQVIYFASQQGIQVGWLLTPTGTTTKYYAMTNEYDASAGNAVLYAVDVQVRT